jgi:hypothetical protein
LDHKRPLERLLEVKRNFQACLTGWELAFGKVARFDESKPNRQGLAELQRFLWKLCCIPNYLKTWCHGRRSKATGAATYSSFGRGVSAERLFLASGLDRGFASVPAEKAVHEAQEAAAERLTGKKTEISDPDRALIARFVRKTIRDGLTPKGTALPQANTHSDGEHGRRVGGQKASVEEWRTHIRDGLGHLRLHKAAFWALTHIWRKKLFLEHLASDPQIELTAPTAAEVLVPRMLRGGFPRFPSNLMVYPSDLPTGIGFGRRPTRNEAATYAWALEEWIEWVEMAGPGERWCLPHHRDLARHLGFGPFMGRMPTRRDTNVLAQ